jgi:hypothetical protein
VKCFFAVFEDRQLSAEEFFIDARPFAWLQRPAIRESFRGGFWLVAGPAANREKEERTCDRPESAHCVTLSAEAWANKQPLQLAIRDPQSSILAEKPLRASAAGISVSAISSCGLTPQFCTNRRYGGAGG